MLPLRKETCSLERIAGMAIASPAAAPDGLPPLAVVRLEVSAGNGRPALYEVANGGFLIGSVAGCDLRLPGANPAPVLALISRHPGGATLRKLTPVQPVLVNNRPASAAYLNDGDRIKVGSVEIAISVQLPPATVRTAPSPAPAPVAPPPHYSPNSSNWAPRSNSIGPKRIAGSGAARKSRRPFAARKRPSSKRLPRLPRPSRGSRSGPRSSRSSGTGPGSSAETTRTESHQRRYSRSAERRGHGPAQ